LTDATTGTTTSTYRYTAYGQPDKTGTTGDDEVIDNDPAKNADIVNPYRFNSKRFDGASGTYDMGFREYNPSINRFVTRDMYNGALKDLALGTDPWTVNRYAFAAGNPITGIELDGHCPMADEGGCDSNSGYSGPVQPPVDTGSTPQPVTEKIGSRDVTATDESAYQHAYAVTKSKLIGDKGGQGQEYMVGCNSTETWVIAGGRRTTCGASDVWFSRLFAEEMCRQSGIECSAYNPTGTVSAIGFSDGNVPVGSGPGGTGTGGRSLSAGSCSFSGETLVEMGDGSRKPISQIKVGDEVLATDPETGEQVAKTVEQVFMHDDTVIDLVVDGEVITTTEDHPFWSVTDHRFERADELEADEDLLGADGRLLKVSGLKLGSQHEAFAYNLSIEGIHTYHVGDGSILVHNMCGIPLPSQVVGRTTPLTTSQAADVARYLGYSRTNYLVKGERVFQSGRSFIVQDTTAHNGGVWKIANSVDALSSKTTRTATTDALLNVIGR
jgi:RHS repeat-associated protein